MQTLFHHGVFYALIFLVGFDCTKNFGLSDRLCYRSQLMAFAYVFCCVSPSDFTEMPCLSRYG